MKEKTKQALRDLRETVADHESEDRGPDVLVNLADLKRLLRWAQNKDHTWFEGDRLVTTGANFEEGRMCTALSDSDERSTVVVHWDGEHELSTCLMYHNEIKLVKL